MNKNILKISTLVAFWAFCYQNATAQQGFGTNQPSKASAIEMKSVSKGLLIPRVALTGLNNFDPIKGELGTDAAKVNSLLVYNTATSTGITPGYYYWTTDGTTLNSYWKRLLAGDDAAALELLGDVTGTLGATTVVKIQGHDVANAAPTSNQVLTWNGTAWTPTSLTPTQITDAQNVTAGSHKVTLGGTPVGATLQPFSIDVVEANLTLSNMGGKVTNNQITTGNAGQVLVTSTDGTTTTWIDQSVIAPTTTNDLTSVVNSMTSNVNGVSSSANIIKTNGLSVAGTELTSTVNGVPATVDLASVVQAGETLTSITQDAYTGVITYKRERDADQTANVVSATSDNLISYDAGAFLDAATVQDNQQKAVVGATLPITVAPTTSGNTTTYTVGVNNATASTVGVVKPGAGLTIDTDGTLNATPAAVTNTITGHKIADVTTSAGTTAINETVTLLSQSATGINYINENGGTGVMAKVVSDNADNLIATGTDFGAFLNATTLETALADGNISSVVDGAIAVTGGNLATFKDVTLAVKAVSGVEIHDDNVKLGGNLTRATTITQDGNAFTIATGGSNLNISGLDKTKVQATDATAGITDRILAVDENDKVKALKAAMPKFFYMPSVMVPTAESHLGQTGVTFSNTTRTGTINLYTIYVAQFGTPVASTNAGALPVLPITDLDFHITYATPDVFTITGIDANTGLMTYTVSATANVTNGSFINIVFSVKED